MAGMATGCFWRMRMTLQVDSGWSQALMDVSVHFQVWAGAHCGVGRGTHLLLLRQYNTL